MTVFHIDQFLLVLYSICHVCLLYYSCLSQYSNRSILILSTCSTSVVCHSINIDQFQFLCLSCLSQYPHRSISILLSVLSVRSASVVSHIIHIDQFLLVSVMSVCSTSVVCHSTNIDKFQFLCLSFLSALLKLSVTVLKSVNFNSC